jgi:hypothetical protein
MSRVSAFALFAASLTLLPAGASASASAGAVEVQLLTIGTSAGLYARFGHAAFVVRVPGKPGVVYNFGYTNFNDTDLVREFLRGRARFWVARERYTNSLLSYQDDDRPVYRQRLALTPAQHRDLARALARVARPENRKYIYHHFKDNCATRLRDMLDRVTNGAVRRSMKGRPAGEDTLRDLVRRGFSREIGLLVLEDLIIGREVDRRPDTWEGTFLPSILRPALQRVRLADGRMLTGAPELISAREGPDPLVSFDHRAGVKLMWWVAGGVALLGLALALLARARSRLAALPLCLLSLLTGFAGLMVWLIASYSTLAEMRFNELVLVLWPLDLALLWPCVRWARGRLWAGRALRGYAWARLVVMALVVLGQIVGLLYQRPLVWVAIGAAFALGLWLAVRWLPRRPPAPRPDAELAQVDGTAV